MRAVSLVRGRVVRQVHAPADSQMSISLEMQLHILTRYPLQACPEAYKDVGCLQLA